MEGWTDLVPRWLLRAVSITLYPLTVGILTLTAGLTSDHPSMVNLTGVLAVADGAVIALGWVPVTYVWMERLGYVSAERRAQQQARAVRSKQRRERRAAYRRMKELGLPELPANVSRVEQLERELGIGEDWPHVGRYG